MNEPMHIINSLSLPESLRGLIECIGEAAALKLIEWRGGTYLCVPKQVDQDNPLFDMLGATAFAKLVDWYSGETVMLPKNDAVMRQMKHALIRQMRFEEKLPVDQIALRTGYTMRRVFQILADDESDQLNGDLFDSHFQ